MKIRNSSSTDIVEIPILNGPAVRLNAGETMECTEAFGEWMLRNWGFLEKVAEEVPSVTQIEPQQEKQPETVAPSEVPLKEKIVPEADVQPKSKKGLFGKKGKK